MPNQVIDGRTVAAAMLEGVLSDVDALRQGGWIPQLVSIRIGDSPAVDLYVRNQKRNADKVGIQFVEKHFPVNISEAEVHATILNLNVDPRVTGIILQRPFPKTYLLSRYRQQSIRSKMLRACTRLLLATLSTGSWNLGRVRRSLQWSY